MKPKSTKDKILQMAVDILEKNGIQSLTQMAVAKGVGIPQGQLTYHFPKRADLIMAVTDMALNRIAETIFKSNGTSNSKTETAVLNLIWKLIQDHPRVRALIGLVTESDQDPDIKSKLLSQEVSVRRLISYSMGVDPEDPLVTSTHALLLGFGIISFLRNKPNDEQLYKDFLYATSLLNSQKPKKKGKKNDQQ